MFDYLVDEFIKDYTTVSDTVFFETIVSLLLDSVFWLVVKIAINFSN